MRNSLILVIYFAFWSLLLHAKTAVVLQDNPYLIGKEDADLCQTMRPLPKPDERSIVHSPGFADDGETPLVKTPFFKFYGTEDLKGDYAGELSKEGLFLNGKKICAWGGPGCASAEERFSECSLIKNKIKMENTKKPKIDPPCDEFVRLENGYKVESQTDAYFKIKIGANNYYISRKETPYYKYVESRHEAAEKKKQALYSDINKNFKKHQNEFIEYVEKMKSCMIGGKNNCDQKKLFGYKWFSDYVCLDSKTNCKGKEQKEKSVEAYYLASLPECFDYTKMKLDIANYDKPHKFTIFTVLTGYDRNVICSYEIKLNENAKDEIKLKLDTQADFDWSAFDGNAPDDMNEENRVIEFRKAKELATGQRRCHRIHGDIKIIPSRLHDKSLQKME